MQVHDAHPPQAQPETAVRRQLRVTERAILQLATSVVRGDPIKSLVELITNSDDSYRRMESHNEASYGRIMITLDRKLNTLSVLDFAQGIDVDSMDECVGTYGSDTSGFSSGHAVRGFYGRGLKEAILGLGSGTVRSIRNGFYSECCLDENGLYQRQERRVAFLSDYVELSVPYGKNGTKISTKVTKIKKLPAFDWVGFALANHTSLRDIMQSSHRRVIFTDGQKCTILNYRAPGGHVILKKRAIPIPGFKATLDLTIYRCDKPLSQDGYTRDGGILIRSKHSIHDSTLFKFDYNPYATRLFGEVRCDYIEELMARGELVVNDKRDGLEQHHPFSKTLRKVVENELQPLVELEMAQQEKGAHDMGDGLKKRFDIALWEINKCANRILRTTVTRGHQLLPRAQIDTRSPNCSNKGIIDAHGGVGSSSFPVVFTGIRLNPSQDPRVRAFFDQDTGVINIATKAPSVAMYYEEASGGKESQEFLTLISELVGDIVFFELASIISGTDSPDRMSDTYKSLKNKYSHLIHRSMRGQIASSAA